MEHVFLPATSVQPTIDFHFDIGKLRISGRSIQADPGKFYEPLLVHLDTYVSEKRSPTTLIIDLEYFNSPATKYLLDILKKLKKLLDNGNELTVKWFYDDEDMGEIAQTMSEASKVPIVFIEKP